MLVLALDSTTRAGSAALWRDAALDVRPGDGSRTHAERLPAELADLTAAHGCSMADVDLFAVASGPGSFTGMRVGIATIQALALVQGKPVVALSTLELLAFAGAAHAGGAALVLSWMEAYRGEVFASITRVRSGAPDPSQLDPIEPAAVGRPADIASGWGPRFAALAGAETMPLIVIGDAVPATTETLRSALGPHATLLDAPPLAGFLGQAAAAAPQLAVRPHAIVPVYVRRPDAELGRERLLAKSPGQADPTSVVPAR